MVAIPRSCSKCSSEDRGGVPAPTPAASAPAENTFTTDLTHVILEALADLDAYEEEDQDGLGTSSTPAAATTAACVLFPQSRPSHPVHPRSTRQRSGVAAIEAELGSIEPQHELLLLLPPPRRPLPLWTRHRRLLPPRRPLLLWGGTAKCWPWCWRVARVVIADRVRAMRAPVALKPNEEMPTQRARARQSGPRGSRDRPRALSFERLPRAPREPTPRVRRERARLAWASAAAWCWAARMAPSARNSRARVGMEVCADS